MDADVDFVIAWVDGADPAWQRERERAACAADGKRSDSSAGDCRYRDWGFLPYWFRGVEQCAPWVRRIFFVTWGHVPDWLNLSHPRLTVVKHTDYIPADYLPTFNSHTIELNFHRIPGLSERFVYFNDDILLLRPVQKTQFFAHGKPKDMLALQPVIANPLDGEMPYIYLNNAMVLCRYFDKRANMKKQPSAYFHLGYPLQYFGYNLLELCFPQMTGFYTVHGASPLLKRTYEELWEREGALLDTVCRHRFRDRTDVSQYLLREWQKLKGDFIPANTHAFFRYFNVQDHNPELVRTICRRKAASVCINDAERLTDFAGARGEILAALDTVFPERSTFET